MPSRFARAIAALRSTSAAVTAQADAALVAPAPRAQDAIADALIALREEIEALNAKIEQQPAAPAAALPPENYAVQNAIDELAPDEGPFRRHLLRTAERLLRAPGATPDTVAATLLAGEDA